MPKMLTALKKELEAVGHELEEAELEEEFLAGNPVKEGKRARTSSPDKPPAKRVVNHLHIIIWGLTWETSIQPDTFCFVQIKTSSRERGNIEEYGGEEEVEEARGIVEHVCRAGCMIFFNMRKFAHRLLLLD